MTARVALLLALLCVSAPVAWCQDEARQQPLAPGVAAPDFSATTLEGMTVTLSQWRGKVVVVNFLITWYRDAAKHLKMMENLADQYSSEGMHLISVSLDEGERGLGEIRKLVREEEIAHPVVPDPAHQVAGLYGVRALPAIFIIDRAGTIAHYYEGYNEGDEKRLSEAIASTMGVEYEPKPAEEQAEEEAETEEEPVCHCFRRKGE